MKHGPYLLDITIPLFLLLFCLLGCCASTRTTTAALNDVAAWHRIKLFNGKGYDWLHAAYKVSDGYVVVGVDDHKGLLIKTDNDGVTQWVQRYSYTAHDELYCAKEIEGGGYVLAGMASGDGENDGLFVKTNSDGREDGHRIFKGKCNRLWGIDETEGGYVLAGSTSKNEFGYVIKTDTNGKKISDATFGTPRSLDTFNSIRQIDNGYLVTGCTGAGTWGARYGWAVTLDFALNKRDQKVYEDRGPLFLTGSLPLANGGYLLAGMVNANGYRACLLKVSKSLDKEWGVTFEGGNNELRPSLFADMRGNCTILSGNGRTGNTWISRISHVGTRENRGAARKASWQDVKIEKIRLAQPRAPADPASPRRAQLAPTP